VYGTSDRGFCAPYPIDWSCAHLPGTELAAENGSELPYACLLFECNPLVADACPDGLQCEFYPAWLYGVNHCWQAPAVDLPLGAACDFAGCGPGVRGGGVADAVSAATAGDRQADDALSLRRGPPPVTSRQWAPVFVA